jgi:hypothetical protein
MKWRRWVGGGLLIIVGLLLVCASGLYASAWYQRWRAEQLLAAVRDLKPGVTTEAEYMKAIQPHIRYVEQAERGDPTVPIPGRYGVANQPMWLEKRLIDLSDGLADVLPNWIAPEVSFQVAATFTDGKVKALDMGEMRGVYHPVAGFVTIHAGRLERLFPEYPEVFTGYSARRMRGKDRVIYTQVDLDERATEEQRRRAIDFRFGCFTAFRRCTDGRQMLDPSYVDRF